MKHLGILAAAGIALTMMMQVASARAVSVVCDNDGRCIQQVNTGATRAKTAHVRKEATRKAFRTVKRSHPRRPALDANGMPGRPIVVPTAAGIDVKVAPRFAAPIQGFIADLKARGIQPRQIHCLARGGHVPGSLHYRGEACDFDFYRGCMGCSARWTRTVADLTAKWGLRNGCSFGDCGHVDSGRIRSARAPWPRTLAETP